MPNVLIVYDTLTGNTETMALSVAKGAEKAGVEVTVQKAEETKPDDFLAADGIILGSPVYFQVTKGTSNVISIRRAKRRKKKWVKWMAFKNSCLYNLTKIVILQFIIVFPL